jgi:hypothetical protein
MACHVSSRKTCAMALSNESVNMPSSSFADGVEFEETFPESAEPTTPEPTPAPVYATAPAPAPIRVQSPAPRLTVIRNESEAQPIESVFQDQLDRRLREAESLVKQTIESVRLEEEKRLAEWVRTRREEEERRVAKWADDRRASVERSIDQRTTTSDNVVQRIEQMLFEWQQRFEERLDQRRMDDERLAERQRLSDEERLQAWRGELESALTQRFARTDHPAKPSPDLDRNPLRDAIATAASARDIGRILRDILSEMAHTAAFALSLHHGGRDEVAYRYRVATDDELGTVLRRDALDDGPQSAAAYMDGWVRAHRPIRAGARNAIVHTAQLALRKNDTTVGVITLQTEGEPVADNVLRRVSEMAIMAAPRLLELRDSGSFRGA